jgi:UDP-N-acetyl-D-glucosamine dehydrogenase
MTQTSLIKKLSTRKALIGIIGLGYVGLPLALRYLEVGYPVLGLDIDPGKVNKLMAGRSYIRHIPSDALAKAVNSKTFSATTDFSAASRADSLILCVPMPLERHREPDLSYVISSLETILPYLRPGQVISLESTTYPGTTDEELKPRIEKAGTCVNIEINTADAYQYCLRS